jgi:acetyl-CoA carboxylase alpha subunit
MAKTLKEILTRYVKELSTQPIDRLVEQRYQRLLAMGRD